MCRSRFPRVGLRPARTQRCGQDHADPHHQPHYAPDEGKVIFDGCEIQPQDVYRIGYLPEERGLYKKMKVGEQAVFFARLKGLSRHEAVVRLKKWFVKFGIESWWDRKVDELRRVWPRKSSSSSRCCTNLSC